MFTCLFTLKDLHTSAVSCLSMSPGDPHSATLVSSGEDGKTYFVPFPLGSPTLCLDSGQHYPTSVAWIHPRAFVFGWENGMVLEMTFPEAEVCYPTPPLHLKRLVTPPNVIGNYINTLVADGDFGKS